MEGVAVGLMNSVINLSSLIYKRNCEVEGQVVEPDEQDWNLHISGNPFVKVVSGQSFWKQFCQYV